MNEIKKPTSTLLPVKKVRGGSNEGIRTGLKMILNFSMNRIAVQFFQSISFALDKMENLGEL